MIRTIFALGMISPGRQRAFRIAAVMHALFAGGSIVSVMAKPVMLGGVAQILLVTGIVEGAYLVGWRLTQIPKSQSLEFLLVSPLRPKNLFYSEALAGAGRLALITISGLPLFLLAIAFGAMELWDLIPVMAAPLIWGAVTAAALTMWAYESRRGRRIGEFVGLAGIVLYLLVGVLAGEKLALWLQHLPEGPGYWFMEGFVAFHRWNPFAVQEYWFLSDRDATTSIDRMAVMLALAAAISILSAWRSASRLKAHFHDLHYRPFDSIRPSRTNTIRDKPLAWWAVHRVLQYSGRMNLYLAGGFGVVYALYLLLENQWPDCLGRSVFFIIENAGGVAVVTTGLVLLAAVPAAFQYGLWDSSAQDRLRRLELLLLTPLRGRDYWDAACAAAWRRGRGYLAIAVLLWIAGICAGRVTTIGVIATAAGAIVLWTAYFALGFRAFASGYQSSGLASFLVIGLPLIAIVLIRWVSPMLAALTPPGVVYMSLVRGAGVEIIVVQMLMGIWVVVTARRSIIDCDAQLREWYGANHGTASQR